MKKSVNYYKLMSPRHPRIFWVLIISFLIQPNLYSQLSRLTYDALTEGGHFAKTMDIHQDYIVIAEPNFTDTINHAGRVHLYRREANSWIHDGLIDNHGQKPFSHFGHDLSVFMDDLIISAPDHGSGKVYSYQRSGTTWDLQSELAIPVQLHREIPHIQFGANIEHQNDWLAISAPGYLGSNDSIIRTGAVFIYKRESGIWSFHQMLLPPDVTQSSQFGNDIEFDGSSLLVSAVKGEGGVEKSGVVYLYALKDDEWTPDYTFINPDSRSHELFGASVDMDHNTIVIGAPMHTEEIAEGPVGVAHVFQKVDDTWIRTALLAPSDGKRNDLYGLTVAVEAGNIFVGSPRHDEPGKTDVGKVYHYVVENSFWQEKTSYVPITQDQQAHMHFGGNLGLDHHQLVISGHLMNNALEDSGIAYTIQVEATTGTSDNPTAAIPVSISPNPASDVLNIKVTGIAAGDLSFTVYSSAGHALLHTATDSHSSVFQHAFEISAFTPGQYFLHVENGNRVSIYKWIKI